MANIATKSLLVIASAAILAAGIVLNKKQKQKKKNNNNHNNNESIVSSQVQQNEEQISEVGVTQTSQQVINQTQINNNEDSSSIYSVDFINRVNKELKAFQETQMPLSFEVLMTITEAGFKLCAQQYSLNQQKNRVERRRVFNNPQQYTLSILEFNNELETLINQKQLDICSKLRISSEIYENSFILQFQTQAALERFIVFQLTLRQKLIASIPSKKELSEQQLAQVANIQLKKLDDINFFQNYLKTLQGDDLQFGSVIITVLLSDIVYQQLGFEEEDILKAVLAYPILKNQLSLIQQKVQALMENCLQ
ncbi:unnamed protein product [Paramecium primaurelia]|uniref:Uncharacterized protein n=1 Tax=Paramecium primaurelia TaxID=5886 RepID=A0A8S1KY49_PARPR|nr:unnamed protein product [Paramecium primaurelia]